MNVIQKTVFATQAVLDALIDSGLFAELDLDQGSPALALDIHDLLADRFLTNADEIAGEFAELFLKQADLVAVALALQEKQKQAQKWIKHKKVGA